MTEPDHELVVERLNVMLRDRTIEQVVGDTRAVVGPAALPVDETVAQRALDKANNGDRVSPEEWAALELVIRLLRPAVFTAAGRALALPPYGAQDPELEAAWPDFQDLSVQLVPRVGRIDDDGGEHIGTGFLAGPSTLVTNRHVLEHLTGGLGVFLRGAGVTFGHEKDTVNTSGPVSIVSVLAEHEELDIALLEIEARQAEYLAVADRPASPGDWIVAIGYPGEVRPSPIFAGVFMNRFGFKRASPGLVRDVEDAYLTHDCSTLGGSSGSPLVAVETGAVVGIHYQGRSAYANHAAPAAGLTQLLARV